MLRSALRLVPLTVSVGSAGSAGLALTGAPYAALVGWSSAVVGVVLGATAAALTR